MVDELLKDLQEANNRFMFWNGLSKSTTIVLTDNTTEIVLEGIMKDQVVSMISNMMNDLLKKLNKNFKEI